MYGEQYVNVRRPGPICSIEIVASLLSWILLTHRLAARNSGSGWYGPSPLDFSQLEFLLSSSCCSIMSSLEFLVAEVLWIWWCNLVTNNAPLSRCSRCSSGAQRWHVASPLLFADDEICRQDGEVLAQGLLWMVAQARLRWFSFFLWNRRWTRLPFSWYPMAQTCYLPRMAGRLLWNEITWFSWSSNTKVALYNY